MTSPRNALSLLSAALFCGGVAAQAATFDIPAGDVAALKSALTTASTDGTDDVINLAAGGFYTLSSVDNTLSGNNGLPAVFGSGTLTINGNGAKIVRNFATGTPDFRLLYVREGAVVTINDTEFIGGSLTSTSGFAGSGAGLLNRGTLTMERCHVAACRGRGVGGIFNYLGSALTIRNSRLDTNTGATGAGAINSSNPVFANRPGALTIENTVIENNTGDGGGGVVLTGGLGSIKNCIIRNNEGGTGGGGVVIGDRGSLVISNSSILNNRVTEGSFNAGGGVLNVNGILTVENSTIAGNSVTLAGGARNPEGFGGGLCNFSDDARTTLVNSTVSGNRATLGGGLYNVTGASAGALALTVRNSTISGNIAFDDGGGVLNNQGLVRIESSTITNNSANRGNGVASALGTAVRTVLANSIVAANSNGDSNGDVDSIPNSEFPNETQVSFSSDGYNLIGSGDALGKFAAGGDKTGISDPRLGALADNGGLTRTHSLLAGSPAIDAGNSALNTDQRGNARPVDVAGVANAAGGNGSDIGAVEAQNGGVAPPSGAVFEVNTTRDGDDGNCNATDCTLREAIHASNRNPGADTISFAIDMRGTIRLANSTLPTLFDNVTINGRSVAALTVDAAGIGRVFEVGFRRTVVIRGLTLRGGASANGEGGGILNNDGTLTLDRCVVSDNNARFGGGIQNRGGTLIIRSSTLSGNSASGSGGAVDSFGGSVTISNSTLAGNSAGLGGAIITGSPTFTIESSTIAGNSATQDGRAGGLFTYGGTVSIGNSIVAGNTSLDFGRDGGSFQSNGYNVVGQGNGANAFDDSKRDRVIGGSSPKLGALADNGGPTPTRLPQAGSPALDAGNSALTTDQRGEKRPFDIIGVPNATGGNGNGSDSGAVETRASAEPLPRGSVFEVNSLRDTDDGACTNLDCTLREAVNASNADPGANTILFNQLDFDAPGKVISVEGALSVPGDKGALTIVGPRFGVELRGIQQDRLFLLAAGSQVALSDMTFSGGVSFDPDPGPDPGITGSRGGAIFNEGDLRITACTFNGNRSGNRGGAIFSRNGSLLLVNSTLSDNIADNGGAIYVDGAAGANPTTLRSCTISGNTGGGVTVITGSSNFATPQVRVTNTIIAGNTGSDVSSFGNNSSFASGGYNLIGRVGGAAFPNATGDRTGITNPQLGALADNGGPTFTRALLTGSLAINGGASDLDNDQRGLPRPQGNGTDIGAFESAAIANRAPVVNPTINSPKVPGPDDLVITDPRGSDADGDPLTYTFVYRINGTTIAGEPDRPNRVDLSKYTVNPGDRFFATFTANDGQVDSAPVTLTRTIAAPPVANPASGTAESGVRSAIGPITGTDPNGLSLRYVLLTQPTSGDAFLAGSADNVQLFYTSARGFSGADSVTFQVVNSEGRRSAPATISITVAGNRAPTASNGSATVTAGVRAEVPLTASDPDGDALRYRLVTAPANGNAFLANNTSGGVSLFYTSNKNYSGPDSIRFSVTDPAGASATGTISITVEGNSAPVANAATLNAKPGERASVVLSGSDADGDELVRYRITSQPSNGSAFLAGSGDNVRLFYTSQAGYTGPDSVQFTVTDSGGRTSAPATVSINVGNGSGSASLS